MKNSTLKSFNFKKALLVCLCLLFGFGITSIFVLNNTCKINNVSAQEIVEQTTEENGERNVRFADVEASSTESNEDVDLYASDTVKEEVDKGTYTYKIERLSTVDFNKLSGGSKVTLIFSSANKALIVFKDSNSSKLAEVTVLADDGYLIKTITIKDLTVKSSFALDDADAVSSSGPHTLEDLDPDYTGTIDIDIDTQEITYVTNLYYETRYGSYSNVVQYYNIKGPVANNLPKPNTPPSPIKANASTFSPADKPNYKTFDRWVFDYEAYRNNYYYKTSLKSVAVGSSVITIIDSNDCEIKLTYNTSIDKNADGSPDYYCVNSISGLADLDQISSHPLLFAVWSNEYTGCYIPNANTWDSYYDTTKISHLQSNSVSLVSFSKNSDSSLMSSGANCFNNSNYVYNYGHYVKEWEVEASYDGIGVNLKGLAPGYSLDALAEYLDIVYAGMFGTPTIYFTPTWKAVSLNVYINGVNSGESLEFMSSYNLGSYATTSSGQTFFNFESNDEYVRTHGSWNYTTLQYVYQYEEGKYNVFLDSCYLDNMYKIQLTNLEANKNGEYELEDNSTYSFDSASWKPTSAVYRFNDLLYCSANVASYTWFDACSADLERYVSDYEELVDGDGNGDHLYLKKIYKDGSDYYIYLVNGKTAQGLPAFKTEYYITIYWYAGNTAFTTDFYDRTKHSAELQGRTVSNSWYQWYGTTFTAYYMKKIYLYYDIVAGTYADSCMAFAYGENTRLDFSAVGTNPVLKGQNKSFGRWYFDKSAAEANGYEVSYASGTLSAKLTSTGYSTYFYVAEASPYDDVYYVTQVWGAVFKQNNTNPILRAEWINIYDVLIDNSGAENDIYWKSLNETKTNSSLFGAASSTDNDSSDFTATLQAGNLNEYKYNFLSSLGTDRKGLAFYNKESFPNSQYAKSSTGDDAETYYVYNYGQYITAWEIYFTFPTGDVVELTINEQGIFHAVEDGVTSNCSISILTSKKKTFKDLCAEIDKYLTAKRYKETLPTVTLIPIWDAATIVNENITGGSTEFGSTEYSLKDQTLTGQTLYAYRAGEDLVALNGVWNYQNLTGYGGTSASRYTINLTPYGIDNIYKVKLANATKNLDGVYELESNYQFNDVVGKSNIDNDSDDIIVYRELSSFTDFADYKLEAEYQGLIDAYITKLTNYHTLVVAMINGDESGDHEIFRKVYYDNGMITDGKLVGDDVDIWIYLANNQQANMPRFKHDLSKLIHWQNENGLIAYTTSDYFVDGETPYSGELRQETSSRVYQIIAGEDESKSVWSYSHGGSIANLSLKARYVYSVRLYYNTGSTYDASVNAGYFGVYTPLDKLNENFEAPEQGNKGFENWVFDKSRATEQNFKVSIASKTITLSTSTGDLIWKFEFSSQNSHNANMYYITKVTNGNGRLVQNQNSPILYAKWWNKYNVTIDNTNTDWKNLKSDLSLYGVVAKNEGVEHANEGFTASLIIGNRAKYAYSYLDSEKDASTGLSFYHASDWKNNEDLWMTADAGYYYVYNYGYYITAWEIYLNLNGNIYEVTINNNGLFSIVQNRQESSCAIKILTQNGKTLQDLAAAVDEFSADSTTIAQITMCPIWKAVSLTVHAENRTSLASGTFANPVGYEINASTAMQKTAKSIMYYYYVDQANPNNDNDSYNNVIARKGVWNYTNISANYFKYARSSGVAGSGVYDITIRPYYVDDIYRVALENAVKLKAGEYRLSNCDFAFNSSRGDYVYNNSSEIRLNFEDGFNLKSGTKYEFRDYISSDKLIDNYITILKDLKNQYLNGILVGSGSTFDIFQRVYYSTGEVSTTAVDDDTLKTTDNPTFHIYLANEQQTGALPIFEKDYYSLIFWKNKYSDYIYTTSAYDGDLHSEELEEFDVHTDESGKMINIWKYKDGYNNSQNPPIVLEANYYRKNYAVNISTINFENQQLERRGYVVLEIKDLLAEESDDTMEDTGGKYLIMFNGAEMMVYNYKGNLINNWSGGSYSGAIVQEIRLYAGCDVTMTVYDQSKDAYSMNSGEFDDIIGYKFNQTLIQTPEGRELFDTVNADQYTYFVDARTVENKRYTNKETIEIAVCFERIAYTLLYQMDNHLAGQFNLHINSSQSGQKTSFELNNISVQQNYKIDYYAYAGYKLENNAFVFNNRIQERTLQTYDESNGDIRQDYMMTKNYYLNNTLDGTWLREYFYVDYNDYSVSNTNLGTLWVKTCPIEFIYGVKVYDDSNINFADSGYIIETPAEFNQTIALEEFKGYAITPSVGTYLSNVGYGFYYYTSTQSVDYALLSSRMYFTKKSLETKDNFYETYSFLLTIRPTYQAALTSHQLSKMVENFEEGKIISLDDRNIYIMLEVRKLLTIDMSVAKLDYDSNATVRTTTISNADNNNVAIKINPNAESVADLSVYATSPIKGYFKTSSPAINADKTVVRTYTYFGLENSISSEFDAGCYADVEYFINGIQNLENKFTIEENAQMIIKYIPGSLQLEYVYKLDGEIKSLADVQDYIIENTLYKPSTTQIFHAGEFVTYVVECSNPDYNLTVYINERDMGSTNVANRKIELLGSNRYQIGYSDVERGKIQILVDLYLQSNEEISVKYQLKYADKRCESDDYGTFDVFENETLKADDVKETKLSVISGRDIYISLNLPLGYTYVGVQQDTYREQNPIIDPTTNKLMLIGDFNTETDSGSYLILIDKISITATLDVAGNVENATSVHKDSSYKINGTTMITDLYVGKVVYFDANPSQEEEYYNFYYLDKDYNKQHILDGDNKALDSMEITSEVLEKVNSMFITFSVNVEQKFRLDLAIVGEEYLKDEDGLRLEIVETSEAYVLGSYQVKGTQIQLMVETRQVGKYNINFNDVDYDSIGRGQVVITLDKNYMYILTIAPKKYSVNTEYDLYTTLNAVDKNEPDSTMEDVNDIPTNGYVYDMMARLIIARQTEDGELYSMLISGNDYQNDLLIVFNKKTFNAYAIVGDEKQEVILANYQIKLTVENSIVKFEYLIKENLNIKFEYKQYKLIGA